MNRSRITVHPGSIHRKRRGFSNLLFIGIVMVFAGLPASAMAQLSYIQQTGLDCGADYLGNTWTCNSSDISIAQVDELIWAGNPNPEDVGCVIGESLTIAEATVTYSINSNARNDLMLWIGEQQNTDPRGFAGAGESCSVLSLPGPFGNPPTAGNPFGDVDGDQCADLGVSVTSASRTFTNVPVTCMDNDGDMKADLQIMLTWDNNAKAVCGLGGGQSFPTDGGTRPKCDYQIRNSEVDIVEGPSLALAKTVNNNSGGNDVASSFNLTLTGADGTHDSGVDYADGDTPTVVAGVEYTVTEIPNSGYTLNSITCEDQGASNVGNPFTPQNGEEITCTVVNTDIAPQLTLIKNVENNSGTGSLGPDDFTLHVTGAGGLCGQDGTDDYVDPDGNGIGVTPVESNCQYTVTEDAVAGYTLLSTICVDDNTAAPVNPLIMSEGQQVTCTLTNTDNPRTGSITLIKSVSGGDAVPGDFTLRITGDGECLEDGTTAYTSGDTVNNPEDGCTYTVSEDDPSSLGYTQGTIACTGDETTNPFTWNTGDSVVCTVTNNVVVTQLALTKVVVNDDGGQAVETDWELCADNGPSSPLCGDGGFTSTTVEPGDYVLNETGGPAGYLAGVWNCGGATLNNGNELTLAAGDDVTCTIVNDDDAPLAYFKVTKDFTDENPGSVEVFITCDTGLPLAQKSLITENNPTTFVVKSFVPGTMDCDIHESPVPAGYSEVYFADTLKGADGEAGSIFADGEGCHFLEVERGFFECEIVNSLDSVDVTVTKEWFINNGVLEVETVADANYSCYNVWDGIDSYVTRNGGLSFDGLVDSDLIEDIFPHYNGGTYCEITEVTVPSNVDYDDDDCANVPVSLGKGGSCTIYNTVFFEGIPTLSQYGLALMALLMLGIGMVGFRRFA